VISPPRPSRSTQRSWRRPSTPCASDLEGHACRGEGISRWTPFRLSPEPLRVTRTTRSPSCSVHARIVTKTLADRGPQPSTLINDGNLAACRSCRRRPRLFHNLLIDSDAAGQAALRTSLTRQPETDRPALGPLRECHPLLKKHQDDLDKKNRYSSSRPFYRRRFTNAAGQTAAGSTTNVPKTWCPGW